MVLPKIGVIIRVQLACKITIKIHVKKQFNFSQGITPPILIFINTKLTVKLNF